MEEEISKEVLAFVEQLLALNRELVDIFQRGDVELFTSINATIKKMHQIQSASEEAALQAVDEDCQIIYKNFDMIVSVLRTTEEGVIDQGAEKAINRFLHNIHEATVDIAEMYGLI